MLSISFSAKLMAQGNLMITPRRVVFEGQKKTQELNLANTGKDTARYLISMMEIRMKEDGSFEKIMQPDSGQNFASSHLRFFPRSVTLAPGEAQTVKVQILKPGELLAGEYRSHIYFRAVPDEKPLGENASLKDTSNISVHLTPIFGISVPVIIRTGESTAQVNFSDLSFEMLDDSTPRLSMVFNRAGNMSVYGDVRVNFISAQGKEAEVGVVKGIAVYTPTSSRQFRFELFKKPGVDYHSGKLHVVYATPADAKPVKFAEAELMLQ